NDDSPDRMDDEQPALLGRSSDNHRHRHKHAAGGMPELREAEGTRAARETTRRRLRVRYIKDGFRSSARLVTLTVALSSLASAGNKLAISPDNPIQLKNSTLQFVASINGERLDGPVKWSSSNPVVARISGASGEANAALLSPGTTTITAAHGGQSAST